MRIINAVALVLILAACQPSTEEVQTITNPETDQKQAAKQVAEETSTPSEKFSLLTELPYDEVTSDESCDKPVVIEFFAYQCPHCYKLETFAEAWKKQNAGKIKFRPVPTHLGHQEFGSFLIVHHAAEKLGLLESAIPALFNRIHQEKKTFASQDEAVNFLVSLGASKKLATDTLGNEELIKKAIDEDFKLLSKYKISGVPTLLVNHRYQFNVTKAGGYDKVFQVVDETLELPSLCSK